MEREIKRDDRFTPVELKEGTKILSYEFNMLLSTNDILLKYNQEPWRLTPSEKNAILESWVSHLRCLISFLLNDRRNCDFLPIDYLEEGKFSEFQKEINSRSDELNKLKKMANKKLAHITKERINFNKSYELKKWDFLKNTEMVKSLFVLFLSLTHSDKICEELTLIRDNFTKQD